MLATTNEKGRGIQWFNQLPNCTTTITRQGMLQRWLHNPRLYWLWWWLKARIKLANGAGTFFTFRPMITHATYCHNHRLIAHWALVVARFRIALLVRLAKLKPDIILSFPHEHIWTLETNALDCLNQTVYTIRGWGKNQTVYAICGWGKNRTICTIRGRTCLLYNNYIVYNCF